MSAPIFAYIFDLDGTLSDTQELHSRVESEVLASYGINIPAEDISPRFAGTRTEEIFAQILKEHNSPHSVDDLLREKWDRVNAIVAKHVEPMHGATEFVRRLQAQGKPLAVASSSPLAYVANVVRSLGLADVFDVLVGGDMVMKGKPDPEIFLHTAERLAVLPEGCVVFEDSRLGMLAAVAAGMRCVGVVADTHVQYPAQHIAGSFTEIDDFYLSRL